MKSTCCRPGALLTALIFALSPALAQQSPSTSPAGAASASPAAKTFSQQDLDRLLAPIALYPDALLVQVLMASTYPLEVVEAARWAKANPKVTGKALEDAMAKQDWDPAVKSLTAVPQVLQQMNDNLDWMQKLGDAFLAQQQDLMDTVQRLRAKADAAGNLKTTEQQVVKTEVQGSQKIYVVESPKPEVVYVPTYNPRPWCMAAGGIRPRRITCTRRPTSILRVSPSRPVPLSVQRSGARPTGDGGAATSISTSIATTRSIAPISATRAGTTMRRIEAVSPIGTRTLLASTTAAATPRPPRHVSSFAVVPRADVRSSRAWTTAS
jgi:hypothetical protein